jgi:hypothetical protein
MGCDIHIKLQIRKDNKWVFTKHKLCDDRSYDSFAILANVRNFYDYTFIPIAEPKGLPEGVNNDNWDFGDHSFSYLSLLELENYNWNRVIKKKKVVSEEEYLKIKDTYKKPSFWCTSTYGPNRITIDASIYENNKTYGLLDQKIEYYINYEWPITYKETSYIWREYILRLRKIAKKYKLKSDEIRIVFGFDS